MSRKQDWTSLSRRGFLASAAGAVLSAGAFSVLPRWAEALTSNSDLPAPLRNVAGDWRLTFEDRFSSAVAFNRNWEKMRKGGHNHETMRYPRNAVIEGGRLDLRLGHQKDAKRPFTGGFVQTRSFRQTYGYFECEMRIAPEAGVNNAIWLVSDEKTEGDIRFELDVAEVKYPNRVLVVARRWRPTKKVLAGRHKTHVRLDREFHRYAMLWTESFFRFYVDDFEVFEAPNDFAHTPAMILLSNAVAPFAGKNDGDVRGAATSYRNLRVYQDDSA
ncbi:glycoside hydrolase family 16 protein [Rhodobacterales bacterium]|nr:glycoside hydrolase family 16 protein [Rhodobacterales bacterium]